MESQQDKKVVSMINRNGVCLLFPDRHEMGWTPFLLPSLSAWCRMGVRPSESCFQSVWCVGWNDAAESVQGCQCKTWLEQNVSHGYIEPEQIMLLRCSRKFWKGEVLKEKGSVCLVMRVFNQPRAVCNKGAVSRVKFSGEGLV